MGNKSSVLRGGSGQRNPVFTTDSLQISSEISSSRLLGGLYSWSKLIKVMTMGQIKASCCSWSPGVTYHLPPLLHILDAL